MISERGNALFLILIAVALFAALSYAVTQSSRGGGSGVDSEKAALEASRAVQFSSAVRTAVMRMMINGTAAANLDFAQNASGPDAVFAPEGGGVAWVDGADILGSGGQNFGVAGIAIDGVGTAADDLIHLVALVPLAYCEAVNDGLGLTNPPVADSDGSSVLIDAYTGEYTACYEAAAGSGVYMFYNVLVAQ